MSDYGIITTGFNRKTLATIITELQDALKAEFGNNIDLSPDSNFSRLLGVYADREEALWELAEDIYYSQWADTATGDALDNVARLNFIARLPAAKTRGFIGIAGDNATVVPAGVRIENERGDTYELLNDVTIDNTNLSYAIIGFTAAYDGGKTYSITVNGNVYSATGKGSVAETLKSLRNDIYTGEDEKVLGGLYYDDDLGEYVLILAASPQSDETFETFTVPVTSELSLFAYGTFGIWEATETGAKTLETGEDMTILNPVSGWSEAQVLAYLQVSVSLRVPYLVTGRDAETDAELRLRRERSAKLAGKTTRDSIEAAVLAMPNITYARVYENYTDAVDSDGRPAKSFEVVAENAFPPELGDVIWENKPAGILSHGDIAIDVLDSSGNAQEVAYTEVSTVAVDVEVTITEYDEEELPSNYEDLIIEAVVDAGNDLDVGVDVIPKRFYGHIYEACAGISDIEIRISNDGGATWQTTPLAMSYKQRASFKEADVTVIKV